MGWASGEEKLRPEEIGELALKEASGECGGRYRLESGMLVAVEGIDGAGVSTTSRALARALAGLVEGGRVCYTKEPTNGPVGHLIDMALDGLLPGLDTPQALALLFAADRVWHLTSKPLAGVRGLLGCLAGGYLAVSDRYKYSSLAYQSTPLAPSGRGLPGAEVEWLLEVNAYAPPAHVLVYVDTQPGEALRRLSMGRWKRQLYEEAPRLEEVSRAFERVISLLQSRPEAPPRGGEAWVRLLEAWGVEAGRLYPAPLGYPVVVRLPGSGRPSANVARAACEVVRVALESGLAVREG